MFDMIAVEVERESIGCAVKHLYKGVDLVKGRDAPFKRSQIYVLKLTATI